MRPVGRFREKECQRGMYHVLTYDVIAQLLLQFFISCACFRKTGNSAGHRQKHVLSKRAPDIIKLGLCVPPRVNAALPNVYPELTLSAAIMGKAPFTGVNCELDVSMCNASEDGSKKCLNGGRCVEGVGATFSCECADGDRLKD